ncbi:MAG: tetraacyldisaccharide 4'-kinase, partial [Gammaproteobacteria bacterium]
LQHYALERDMEIAVIDGERRLGNGHYLPAGPLREQATRLRRVDIMVVNGKALPGECRMQLVGTTTQSLVDAHVKRDLGEWRDARVHAVAGIGNPARFFDQLRGQDHWYVPVSARFDADCQRRLQHLLAKIKPHGSTG